MTFQLRTFITTCTLALAAVVRADGDFVPEPKYSSVLKSPLNPNITISYKTPDPGTCSTIFPEQKQYSGYITIPPSSDTFGQQNYTINTFFWFFEARSEPENAPLTLWFNGGPGSSSMIGLFQETGPCEVVQTSDGSYGTEARLWGWDRSSNLLYIDQPTQVGFSYDQLRNLTFNILSGQEDDTPSRPDEAPWIKQSATLPSLNSSGTANTTTIAAHATWQFLQSWLNAFPDYNPGHPPNSTTFDSAGIHLFTESYGGLYGPAFADFFDTQNERRRRNQLGPNSTNTTVEIQLESIGIINGLVDQLVQGPYFPQFANNNTYHIQMIDDTAELNALSSFDSPDNCGALVQQCRSLMNTQDPNGDGDELNVNTQCFEALKACSIYEASNFDSSRSFYDIRQKMPESFPSRAYLEYLNQADVQQSIGARVNYTQSNPAVQNAFISTGDQIRGNGIRQLADLLNRGIRVAFIYGDADYICNWLGGQAVSMAVAGAAAANYPSSFPSAGYAKIVTNDTYVGGEVRQYGNLSFSRIYDAGHEVPAFQPETAFEVFSRVILGTDISTGNDVDLSIYTTNGPANTTYVNSVPDQQAGLCWIRSFNDTCSQDQQQQMQQYKGVVKAGVWYSDIKEYVPPPSSVVVGIPGSPIPTSSTSSSTVTGKGGSTTVPPATGVFTATMTPTSTKSDANRHFETSLPSLDIFALLSCAFFAAAYFVDFL